MLIYLGQLTVEFIEIKPLSLFCVMNLGIKTPLEVISLLIKCSCSSDIALIGDMKTNSMPNRSIISMAVL